MPKNKSKTKIGDLIETQKGWGTVVAVDDIGDATKVLFEGKTYTVDPYVYAPRDPDEEDEDDDDFY